MSSWQNADHSIIYIIFAIRKLLKQQSALKLKKTHIHNPVLKKGNELKYDSFILGMPFAGKSPY